MEDAAAHKAYDMIDRHLRATLDDDRYAEYSSALEVLWNRSTGPQRNTDPDFLSQALNEGDGVYQP